MGSGSSVLSSASNEELLSLSGENTELNCIDRGFASWLPSAIRRATCSTPIECPGHFSNRQEALAQARTYISGDQFEYAVRCYITAANLSEPIFTDLDAKGTLQRVSKMRSTGSGTVGQSASPLVVRSEGFVADDVEESCGNSTTEGASIYAELGRAYFARNRLSEAIAAFDRAEMGAPSSAEILYEKAVVLNMAGDHVAAFNLLNRGVELQPSCVLIRFLLAVCCCHINRLDDAVDQLIYIMSMEPNRLDALSLLADCYERQSKYHEAARCLKRSLLLEPEDFSTKRSLARVNTIIQNRLPEGQMTSIQMVRTKAPQYLKLDEETEYPSSSQYSSAPPTPFASMEHVEFQV